MLPVKWEAMRRGIEFWIKYTSYWIIDIIMCTLCSYNILYIHYRVLAYSTMINIDIIQSQHDLAFKASHAGKSPRASPVHHPLYPRTSTYAFCPPPPPPPSPFSLSHATLPQFLPSSSLFTFPRPCKRNVQYKNCPTSSTFPSSQF